MASKLDHVEICVCCRGGVPEGEVYYGLPELRISLDRDGAPLFEAVCPLCRRATVRRFRTAPAALREWNDMMRAIRRAGGYYA